MILLEKNNNTGEVTIDIMILLDIILKVASLSI